MMWGHSEFGPQRIRATANSGHSDAAARRRFDIATPFEEDLGSSGLIYNRMQRLSAGCSQLVGGLYLTDWVLGTGEG